eukprot:671400-Amphidinium_carterae.1
MLTGYCLQLTYNDGAGDIAVTPRGKDTRERMPMLEVPTICVMLLCLTNCHMRERGGVRWGHRSRWLIDPHADEAVVHFTKAEFQSQS